MHERCTTSCGQTGGRVHHVLDEGNTLLGEEELEMLTILRMNRAFMDFMRKEHGNKAKQQSKATIQYDCCGS